jgi:hypothetical protein
MALDDVAGLIRDHDGLAPAVPAQTFVKMRSCSSGCVLELRGCGFSSARGTIFVKRQLMATSMDEV